MVRKRKNCKCIMVERALSSVLASWSCNGATSLCSIWKYETVAQCIPTSNCGNTSQVWVWTDPAKLWLLAWMFLESVFLFVPEYSVTYISAPSLSITEHCLYSHYRSSTSLFSFLITCHLILKPRIEFSERKITEHHAQTSFVFPKTVSSRLSLQCTGIPRSYLLVLPTSTQN